MDPHLEDPRQCALCLKYGDADSKVKEVALGVASAHSLIPLLSLGSLLLPLLLYDPLLPPQEAGRLLYIGQNEWTHVNCAIWSAEVFEENDGSLKNVHAAVARGRQMVRGQGRLGCGTPHQPGQAVERC